MQIRIVINSVNEPGSEEENRSEVWSGDIEILDGTIYITKISILGDGQPQPICDIPFAIGKGYYVWVPGELGDTDPDAFGALINGD